MLTALDALQLYFQTLQARNLRRSITARARAEAVGYDMAAGRFTLTAGDDLPAPTTGEAQASFNRIARQVTCAGPKVMRARLHGTVKEVTWGGTKAQTQATTAQAAAAANAQAAQLDARLDALNLHELAARGYEQLFITGLVAFWAHRDALGVPRITRLSGYLEPLPATAGDVDTVGGLLQVWQPKPGRWTVRVYDLEESRVREWQDVKEPLAALALKPTLDERLEAPPRVGIAYQDAEGLPVGEMVQGANLIRAEMVSQFKVKRLEELHAFPVPVVEGAVDFPTTWAPGQPVKVQPGGSFRYVEPGGLERVYSGQTRDQDAIRDFFSLPAGVMSSSWPSGDALAQANARFNAASRYYGRTLGQPLARAVADLADLYRMADAPRPEVLGDYMGEAAARWRTVRELFDAGLVPLAPAARAVQDAVPGWSDDELEAFVAQHAGDTTPGQVEKIMAALDAAQDPRKAPGQGQAAPTDAQGLAAPADAAAQA